MSKPKTTVESDKQITSWEDQDGFTLFIQPKMATAKDINEALETAKKNNPKIVIGSFQGIIFRD